MSKPRRRKWIGFLVVFACLVAAAAVLFPVFARAKVGRGGSPQSRIVGAAAMMEQYLERNDDRFPLAFQWMDAIKEHPRWADKAHSDVGIAFFEPLSGVKRSSIKNPGQVPMLFLSSPNSKNLTSGLDALAFLGDEEKYTWVCFVDGHVERMPYSWRFETIVLEVEQE